MISNRELVALCKDVLSYIGEQDEAMPEASHSGSCNPESGCDGACMDRYYAARANHLRYWIRRVITDETITNEDIVARIDLLSDGMPTAIGYKQDRHNTPMLDQILLDSIFDLLRLYVVKVKDQNLYSPDIWKYEVQELNDKSNKLYEAILEFNRNLPEGLWDVLNKQRELYAR